VPSALVDLLELDVLSPRQQHGSIIGERAHVARIARPSAPAADGASCRAAPEPRSGLMMSG
jgi:hypothetical protein